MGGGKKGPKKKNSEGTTRKENHLANFSTAKRNQPCNTDNPRDKDGKKEDYSSEV